MPSITIPKGPAIGTSEKRILSAYSFPTEISRHDEKVGELAPSAPLLIQLRQAYLLSPEIRPSVDQQHRGEVVSMAIGPGEGNKVRVISPVERFVYDKDHDWQAEGTEKRQRVLPAGNRWQAPDGNTFWDEDGLPLRAESDKNVAIKAWEAVLEKANIDTGLAQKLASYFWRRSEYKDFAAVRRYSDPGHGPWDLYASWSPGVGHGGFGVRSVERRIERP